MAVADVCNNDCAMFFLDRRRHDYRRYTGEDLYQNKTADTVAVVRQTGKT